MSNVLKYAKHSKRYYLRHPFEWVRDKRRSMKWAKQRVVRGYADCDIWNLDHWFVNVIPKMLNGLADANNSWPSQLFDTPEEWAAWLRKTALAIDMMGEDRQDEINKYWPQYRDEIDNWQGDGYKWQSQAFKNYADEAQKIAAEAQANFEVAMNELSKYFSALWD